MAEKYDGLERGQLTAWTRGLRAEQKEPWKALWAVFQTWRRAYQREATGKSGAPDLRLVETGEAPEKATPDLRAALRAAFDSLAETISPQQLQNMVATAMERGDATTLRLLATMAGIDLGGAPEEAPFSATVIVLSPFDQEVQAAYEQRLKSLSSAANRDEDLRDAAPVHDSPA